MMLCWQFSNRNRLEGVIPSFLPKAAYVICPRLFRKKPIENPTSAAIHERQEWALSELVRRHVAQPDLEFHQYRFEFVEGQMMFPSLDPVQSRMRNADPLPQLGVRQASPGLPQVCMANSKFTHQGASLRTSSRPLTR